VFFVFIFVCLFLFFIYLFFFDDEFYIYKRYGAKTDITNVNIDMIMFVNAFFGMCFMFKKMF
jgi:hypothetical protein